MKELNRKLLWLMAIRVLVVLSLLLPALINPGDGVTDGGLIRIADAIQSLLSGEVAEEEVAEPESPAGPADSQAEIFQFLVALVSIQTLIYALLLRGFRSRPEAHGYIQLCGDALLITLLIYKFGGATVNLSILYLVNISVASFLLRRLGGLAIATVCAVLYGLVAFAHQSQAFHDLWARGGPLSTAAQAGQTAVEPQSSGLLKRLAVSAKPPPRDEVSGVPVAYTLPVHVLGFYIVALFTGYLSRDVALERKLEERSHDLAYLQVLHQDVVQSISSGLLVTDLDGKTTSLNRIGIKILRLEQVEWAGRHVTEIGLFSPSLWAEISALKVMERGEVELEDDLGSTLFLGFTLSSLRDTDGAHRGFIVNFQDLTEWRRLQEQVRIQDRMAAIGQMAAGLAHEVGNPLAAISGSVQLLSRSVEAGSAGAKLLDITQRESQRLDRTVKAFLQFAKPRDRHEETVEIGELLRADSELLRNSEEFLESHRLELDFDPPSATLRSDRDQISQMFWNLARNSLRAMPEGGTLRIEGRLLSGRYRLRFIDDGRGMSEQERAELFQPFKSFFDGGTGLGMAIVYRIVEEHAGNIEVDSEPGRGTSITIDLPVQERNHDPNPEAAAQRRRTPAVEEQQTEEMAQ
ncbi:MAG: ATP-binding protein [Acidobacteriota bacterium]